MTTPLPATKLSLIEQLAYFSQDALLAFDDQFRYTYWNPAMERISGLSAADVLGQNAFQLFPFLVETGEDQCFRRALAGERVISHDRPFDVPGTNRRGFYEAHYGPLLGDQGQIIGGTGVVRDITDRKLAEARVQETESRFRNMADVSPVMLWMSDTTGLCTFFNQSWLRFTGRALEDEWGISWAEGVHFEDFQRCMDTYVAAFNAREVFEMEYRLRRADGQFRWILDRGTPRYLPDGSFSGFIGSCIDITERKQLEADLRAAVRTRDDFLSVASHELKTPLTSLQLHVESIVRLIRRGATDLLVRGGRLAQASTAMAQQTAHLTGLVEGLLDVSRLSSGKLELEPTELDFAALTGEVVERWRSSSQRSDLSMESRLAQVAIGHWDRLRLEQVLNNLLGNAVKYGAGNPILVTVSGDERWVRLTVKDQGIGIDPADQERIFARFERAVPTRSYGGLGLGLWITREIVHRMGGSISVASAVGQGATFEVSLPVTSG